MEASDGVASFFLLDRTCTHLALVHNIQLKSKSAGWGLPGGRLNGEDQNDEGCFLERFKKAAWRELWEETGLAEKDVEDLEFFHRCSVRIFNGQQAIIPVVVFAGRALTDIVKNTAVPKETDRCDWFPFCPDNPTKHLPQETYHSHKARIEEIVAALKKEYAWDHIQYIRKEHEKEKEREGG